MFVRGNQNRTPAAIASLPQPLTQPVAKVIIYEDGKGKTNGDWPDLRNGVYALIRANDEIGDRIWNELLPPQLPAELHHANRDTTIGVAPRHSEQFAYIRVTEENLEVIARYLAVCALV